MIDFLSLGKAIMDRYMDKELVGGFCLFALEGVWVPTVNRKAMMTRFEGYKKGNHFSILWTMDSHRVDLFVAVDHGCIRSYLWSMREFKEFYNSRRPP